MDLRLKSALARDISYRLSTYREAQTRRDEFAPHAAPEDVLAVLARPDQVARLVVLRALIDEYQKTHDPLWSAMLLVAFYPAIRKTMRRLRWAPDTVRAEIGPLAVEMFLRAVRGVALESIGDGLAKIIVIETARGACRVAKTALQKEEQASRYHAEVTHLTRHFAAPASDVLHDIATSFDSEKALAGRVNDLREDVERRMAGASTLERERAYEREKRARSRATARRRADSSVWATGAAL